MKHVLGVLMMVVTLVSCGLGPVVQHTPAEQARIDVKTYEDTFMSLYHGAYNYILQNPQYNDKWNNYVQPAFSNAHKALTMYEQQLLGNQITKTQMDEFTDKIINDLTVTLQQINYRRIK